MGGGMKLVKAQVKNYRSIIDSGPFDVERTKTILVGPNEAGKTVLLRALQQINPPDDVPKFEALRDYPRLVQRCRDGNGRSSEDRCRNRLFHSR
jgi:predicted ATP-dependent endonuclease of OLD family